MKTAVLINPSAGGVSGIGDVCRAIDHFLAGTDVCTATALGGGLVRAPRLIEADANGYVPRLQACVDALAAQKPDFYVVAGGDGFAAYVADRLLRTGHARPRILGVAMGTANVGPIIAFSAGNLENTSPETLAFTGCGAIEAFDGNISVAYGFNDIVLGNTILGTLDGKAQAISARAMALEGQKVPETPLEEIARNLTVAKNGLRSPSALPHAAQIVASAMERENLYGRAVSGMLCFAGWQQTRAALLVSERPLVVTDYDPRGFAVPALFEQVMFGAGDEITIEGLLPEALIIADGNPYPRAFGPVSLRYRPGVIQTAKL